MNIPMNVLCRIVDRPDGNTLIAIHRHYCSQLYMYGHCTTHCERDCGATLKRLYEGSRGEFVVKPTALLVSMCREYVSSLTQKEHQAVTPVNELGEATPEADPFASLVKHYEATSTLG